MDSAAEQPDSTVQMSFYSAAAAQPRVADLAGILCGTGQTVSFGRGTAARLSAVVTDGWRARALVRACAERGVDAELAMSEEGRPSLRTAFRADLVGLASGWQRGAVKAVPAGLELDGPMLAIWCLAAGRRSETGYLLGLDPHAPDTHEPLVKALTTAGILSGRVGPRGGGPAVKVSGKRRLARLAELVGEPPEAIDPACWPGPPLPAVPAAAVVVASPA